MARYCELAGPHEQAPAPQSLHSCVRAVLGSAACNLAALVMFGPFNTINALRSCMPGVCRAQVREYGSDTSCLSSPPRWCTASLLLQDQRALNRLLR